MSDENKKWFKPQLSFDGVAVVGAIVAAIVFLVRIDLRQQFDEDNAAHAAQLQSGINDKLQGQLDIMTEKLNSLEKDEVALHTIVYDRLNIKP